jgi:F0F1-type ATP synthase assembly protein I
MTTDNCAEINDAKRVEQKSGIAEPVKQHRYSDFMIPAGILIGLGAGVLADHLFAGFLAGLGLGLVVSELLPSVMKSEAGECRTPGNTNVTVLLIGVFLVLVAASLVFAPAAIWPYAFAGFFILAGIAILARGFSATSR